ncbi:MULTISPECIES: cobalt-precorrin-7 (C(5))-methyltransferase [Yersinia]|jgi:cobalt-precorrin-7 (C5)-methyltransferase|uniref:Cobalt-precorrin-7 (C(5))-methyltransferase n=1 Tax=Yersinia intermedia TaxID=631 RepID=A0ABX6F8S5_YERIN|nr:MULTISPECIES: cobalt-precorrin-7 (C(5))-methyltransferase [Yersinia]AJJ21211.1 precorrin-6y C5,15-methyltransferase (decarboxylating), CbiE subunit [Yersinia intermedia]ARB85592.1 cobalt-precorrin-7 (C(5))-methyltransferase [Yersinia sp. FDAARGOS_228]AVL35423.1 cobalt-precorrin-7 (C(5))-methyltransferase [Yersinia intermedia]MCB5297112.1 cobalt-precorrin-7 (C(5))-methyltransferase [Yersinia intermedia]MDA5479915.1 cobalt-precorrin-7 (C(5))-methyltransferase [Yersinia intermedia]
MITVVGIGPGDIDYLTPEARRAISQAEVLVGGKRHLATFSSNLRESRLLDADLLGLLEWLDSNKARAIVVLASGDPLLYGIGKLLAANFGTDELHIVPGISAIQYLCAKVALDMNDLFLTSSHGRVPDFDWIFQHDKVAMVTDSVIGPRAIADALHQRGLSRTLIIGENLSQPNERIHRLSQQQVAARYDMNVVVILNER